MTTTFAKNPLRQPGRPKDLSLTKRRKEEILEAAARIFAREGYPNTDLQVIASELGVAKGTLYRYFPSKQELFLASVDRGMQTLTNQVKESMSDIEDPLDKIRIATKTYFSFFDDHPELIELIAQERAEFKDRKKPTYFEYREANMGFWFDLFSDLIAKDRIRNIKVEKIITTLSNLVYGTMYTTYFIGHRKSLVSQTDDILDIVFQGILSPSERNSFKSKKSKE
jgi:AcrR family transcriptional regulator